MTGHTNPTMAELLDRIAIGLEKSPMLPYLFQRIQPFGHKSHERVESKPSDDPRIESAKRH